MDIKKQKQVYEILYMPIEVISSSGFGDDRKVSIKKEGNVIKTTQTYWPEYRDKVSHKLFRYDFNPDCDMSDFACGFYEIIYKSILAGDVLVNNNNGCMVNKQYVGDTMTSVSLLPGLYEKYHCLANFWIIPMELGRRSNHILSKTSKRYNVQDFMDRFLLLMKYRFDFY
ncbi:MAG: hypothetical protein UEA60_10405 [Lachnospiraceae bacterium]|nr:hypothetical protein [Lachnospiraceae bacterium]